MVETSGSDNATHTCESGVHVWRTGSETEDGVKYVLQIKYQ